MGCRASSQWRDGQSLTQQEAAELQKVKREVYGKAKNVSVVLLGLSIICMGCGIVQISLGWRAGFPITACTPIWSGFIMLLAAVFGLLGCSTDPSVKRMDGLSKQDYYMNGHRTLLWWMCVWMGMCLGYGIYGIVVCAMEDEERCPDYPDVLLAVQIVALVLYFSFIACNIITCRIFRPLNELRKGHCSLSAERNVVHTSQGQTGIQLHNQYGTHPPTYDQSMSTSKY